MAGNPFKLLSANGAVIYTSDKQRVNYWDVECLSYDGKIYRRDSYGFESKGGFHLYVEIQATEVFES